MSNRIRRAGASDSPAQFAGVYEIRIRGPLGPTLREAFLTLSVEQRGADAVLRGMLPDQAALYGVLHQIEGLGLELLEVRCPGR
jgi:hypothetical protein